MKKIVLLPLDERPCNYEFPYKLFNSQEIRIVRPEKLGDKKCCADSKLVNDFLKRECRDAYALVLSMDMLLYGGLIPSRLHNLSEKEVLHRLEIIKLLKAENKDLKIYSFQCIMRCPKYSSNDEEPDYYEECGEEIHHYGETLHKQSLLLELDYDITELAMKIKPEYLIDFRQRRAFNLSFNIKTLDYLKQGYIDFLILPQDDSAKYGFTAMDQEVIREEIAFRKLQEKAIMYPGADEIALTLLSRIVNEMHGRKPKIYVKYASIHAPFIIPAYEDRSLGETIKYHILASGSRMVSSYAEADLVIALSAPANEMKEAIMQPVKNQNYCVERNLLELIEFIKDCILDGKPVTIGDNAYSNGADLELVDLLNQNNLLLEVAGYAGWNTSSNTIGTAIAEGIHYLYFKDDKSHLDFLALRYMEDAGYCSVVRSYITKNELHDLEMNYFDVKERNGIVSKLVEQYLVDFSKSILSSIANHIQIHSVDMPWKRMFEVGLDITYLK